MKSKIIVPIAVLGIITVVSLSSVSLASAQQSGNGETLVSRIATRFGLNETEVKETFSEFKSERFGERHEKMQGRLEERLSEAVDSGELTSDQMFAILEKHEELEGRSDDLHDLSPEDAREAKADIHEEMESWAQENDIDMSKLQRFEGSMKNRGGKFMHGDR